MHLLNKQFLNEQSNSHQVQIEKAFENMWQDYLALNPEALKIYQLLSENNLVINDHVAFRTFGLDGIRVEDIAAPLLTMGYKEIQSYYFEKKNLRAKHYEHPNMPLVFISELIVESFSLEVQTLIKQLVSQLDFSKVESAEFIYSGRHWNLTSEVYNRLLAESEYAAWVAAFGYRPNHFTVSINHLEQFKTIEAVNEFIKENNFKLNTSGGEIKGNHNTYLEQSSTLANSIDVEFADKTMAIPSCFYEFALRHKMQDGQLFKGFVAASADKIFESTNVKAA
jgi:hypothetical protein